MVSKKTIKEYDFNSIEDYFEYIVESVLNGQRTQAKELISKLSKAQKLEGYNYLNDRFEHFYGEAKQMIIGKL